MGALSCPLIHPLIARPYLVPLSPARCPLLLCVRVICAEVNLLMQESRLRNRSRAALSRLGPSLYLAHCTCVLILYTSNAPSALCPQEQRPLSSSSSSSSGPASHLYTRYPPSTLARLDNKRRPGGTRERQQQPLHLQHPTQETPASLSRRQHTSTTSIMWGKPCSG